jgi:hypothetical protein
MSTFAVFGIFSGLADRIDYCIVAFAIIVVVSVVQWIVDGRKNFTGPKVEH